MIEEIEIDIQKLFELICKGDDISLRDKKKIDNDLKVLRGTVLTQIFRDGEYSDLTHVQQLFIRKLLPTLLEENLPRLIDVLNVYDMKITDKLFGIYESW